MQKIQEKQEALAAIKEIANEKNKTVLPPESNRKEIEADTTATPPKGMI